MLKTAVLGILSTVLKPDWSADDGAITKPEIAAHQLCWSFLVTGGHCIFEIGTFMFRKAGRREKPD
jgi:hypothetical protein